MLFEVCEARPVEEAAPRASFPAATPLESPPPNPRKDFALLNADTTVFIPSMTTAIAARIAATIASHTPVIVSAAVVKASVMVPITSRNPGKVSINFSTPAPMSDLNCSKAAAGSSNMPTRKFHTALAVSQRNTNSAPSAFKISPITGHLLTMCPIIESPPSIKFIMSS